MGTACWYRTPYRGPGRAVRPPRPPPGLRSTGPQRHQQGVRDVRAGDGPGSRDVGTDDPAVAPGPRLVQQARRADHRPPGPARPDHGLHDLQVRVQVAQGPPQQREEDLPSHDPVALDVRTDGGRAHRREAAHARPVHRGHDGPYRRAGDRHRPRGRLLRSRALQALREQGGTLRARPHGAHPERRAAHDGTRPGPRRALRGGGARRDRPARLAVLRRRHAHGRLALRRARPADPAPRRRPGDRHRPPRRTRRPHRPAAPRARTGAAAPRRRSGGRRGAAARRLLPACLLPALLRPGGVRPVEEFTPAVARTLWAAIR